MSDIPALLKRLASIAEMMEDDGIGRGDWCDGPAVREAAKVIDDQRRELQARREILDAITKNVCMDDGNCWMKAADINWQQRLRDFANDSEQHQFEKDDWITNRGNGVVLYAAGGFFTAYYDDAAELWGQADDTLPMFHVMVQSDSPHRTVIHPMHLVAWVEHLASICMPVEIMSGLE